MLTLEECFGFCELDPVLLEALAHHQHVPTIVAAELATTWLQTPRGVYQLHSALLEEIESAWNSGSTQAAKSLDRVYSGFRREHPMPRVIS